GRNGQALLETPHETFHFRSGTLESPPLAANRAAGGGEFSYSKSPRWEFLPRFLTRSASRPPRTRGAPAALEARGPAESGGGGEKRIGGGNGDGDRDSQRQRQGQGR